MSNTCVNKYSTNIQFLCLQCNNNNEAFVVRRSLHIKELIKAQEQNRKAVNAAEEICTCNACIEARMK